MRLFLLYLLASCVACGAARGRSAPSDTAPSAWHYDVEVAPSLARMSVRVCFDGKTPKELRAGKDSAASHIESAHWLSPGSKHRLPIVRGRVQLEQGVVGGCVQYVVNLDAHRSMDSAVHRVEGDVVASTNVWLWRPVRRAKDVHATLTLRLPDGMRASLPFVPHGDGYILDADSFRFDSYAGFGQLREVAVDHRGVHIDAAVLSGAFELDDAGMRRWLKSTIDVGSTMNGRFPTKRVQLLIVPSGASQEPVRFGAVARGGSGSVLLFVSSNASEHALIRDWVLPHELSHLYVPFVHREDAWLPEGLATYYQEVLRSRAGVVSEHETLAGLSSAMSSASRQGTGRNLADESEAMHRTYAYRAVYWGGAAFFLMADVALRERSGGTQSLDSVLVALQKHPPPKDVLSASALLAHMDALAGLPVLTPLAQEVLDMPFPPFEQTLRRLGVRRDQQGEVVLDERAELAALRSAIFAKR